MPENGYIKLYRRLTKSHFWLEEKFTRGQAWVDLISMANYKETTIRIRGIKITVSRGTTCRSIVTLAERWHWSRGKVYRFLTELETEQMIEHQNSNVTSLIKIINYELYQGDDTPNETLGETPNGHQTDTKRNTYNKNKKDKKNKNKELIIPLIPFLDYFPEDWQEDEEFKEAWADWLAFRSEIKKKLTPRAAKAQAKFLQSQGLDAIAIIRQSIQNSYQGLFELKRNGKQPKSYTKGAAEWLAQKEREYAKE